MTDELTPEEKKAFESLPRERMPAGLEGRVVDAMRDHGFLAKRRRAIELTSGRVAGVLAASVALMIGAYSIGLHRGDGRQAPFVPETMKRDLGLSVQAPRFDQPTGKAALPASRAKEEPVSREKAEPKPAASELKKENAASAGSGLVSRLDEAPAERGRLETEAQDALESAAKEKDAVAPEVKAPSAAADKVTGAMPAMRAVAPPSVTKHPLTFMLNGSPVTVDADSTRVITDQQGRVLLIYTSDGIIRLRLSGQ